MFSAASSMNIDAGWNILCAAEQINYENKTSLKQEIFQNSLVESNHSTCANQQTSSNSIRPAMYSRKSHLLACIASKQRIEKHR